MENAGRLKKSSGHTGRRFSFSFDWEWAGFFLLLALVALFLALRFVPAISEPDANGYWAQGSLIARTGQSVFLPSSPAQYVGMHWLLTPDGYYMSRYPPGLAVLIAPVYLAFGYRASLLVNPVLALAALAGLFFLAGEILPRGWRLLAVVFLAINPLFLRHARECDSHMAVVAFLVWGLGVLLRWSREGHLRQAFLAGLLLGCIPTIRYPEAVMGLAVALFLVQHHRCRPIMLRHYVAAAAGAALPILPLLVRNHLVLGAFWRTGYTLSREQTGFSWAFFKSHAMSYLRSLNDEGLGLLLAPAMMGLTLMLCRKSDRRLGILWSALSLPVMVLYMSYYWGGEGNMFMRFLLPVFPGLILCAVWALEELTRPLGGSARMAMTAVLLLMQAGWGGREIFQGDMLRLQKEGLAALTDSLAEVSAEGDVVLAGDPIQQHLDFVRRWRLADAALSQGLLGNAGRFAGGGMLPPAPPGMAGPGAADPGRNEAPDMAGPDRDGPSPMQLEKQQSRMQAYRGLEGRSKYVRDVRAWARGRRIFLIGSEADLNRTGGAGSFGKVQVLKRLSAPRSLPENRIGAPRGGMPRMGPGGVGMARGVPGPQGGAGRDGPPGGGLPNRLPAGLSDALVIARWDIGDLPGERLPK